MSGAGEWLAAQQAADQRRFLNLLAGSVAAHVGFVAMMGVVMVAVSVGWQFGLCSGV